ncbi:hypothetical protein M8C13_01425 [Crossiella sp. SN42]|uniref:DUF7282 domain-containing protein n=1 Tax=Crossiella sp. SN42 TaxID=2944808 RepID=UPI00207D5BE0|nr:hypothetical protein [Crossiella sp. SN42]MCO1574416.1 hypothetical protein [Crossiella sp. SN42]
MTNQHRAKFLIATAGVLGVLLSGCAGGAGAAPGAAAPLPIGSVTPTSGTAQPGNQPNQPAPVSFPSTEIDADDQRGDGTKVLIEEAELPKAGHVAIYDQSGKLLGSAPVPPGAHRDLAVTLNPALGQGNHSLRAVLTTDDGDGKFDATKDAPVREFDDDQDGDDDHDDELENDGFRYTVG